MRTVGCLRPKSPTNYKEVASEQRRSPGPRSSLRSRDTASSSAVTAGKPTRHHANGLLAPTGSTSTSIRRRYYRYVMPWMADNVNVDYVGYYKRVSSSVLQTHAIFAFECLCTSATVGGGRVGGDRRRNSEYFLSRAVHTEYAGTWPRRGCRYCCRVQCAAVSQVVQL